MGDSAMSGPIWLAEWMESHEIALWGMADLRGFDTPGDEPGYRLPFAVSWAIPMNPLVMVAIRSGPNREYADEYARVNRRINELAVELATRMREAEFRSLSLAASERSDPVNIRGIFPHKTAATRAGLGWIGRHCQLVTRPFGPWIRLGTVFTDMELDCGPPTEKSF